MKTIVITDLDGSLLHPKTYSFQEALPALDLLRERGIPVIMCSSKTRAEVEVYRERMDNRHPFIVENGGGIFIPEAYFPFFHEGEKRGGYQVLSLGTPYNEIRKQFVHLRETRGVRTKGFGDMTPDEVVSLTGLARDEAVRAMQREYDEPFVFYGAPDERFLRAIEMHGLHWTEGRFFHILGSHDKGTAVLMLRDLYERMYGHVVCVGLGDSLNDRAMLLTVDRPVLIRKEDGNYDPRIAISNLYRTEEIGPTGWNEAILKMIQQDPNGFDNILHLRSHEKHDPQGYS